MNNEGQQVNEKVRNYFSALPTTIGEKRKFKCLICSNTYMGTLSNLKDHLICKHKEISIQIGLKERNKRAAGNSSNNNAEDNEMTQLTKKVKLDVDLNEFIQSHIKTILRHNHSLSSIEDTMNMSHNKQILESFKVVINRRTFTQFVTNAAQQIYKLIEEETKGNFPSLMFDSASKHGRSVFSASVRYVKEGKLKDRTLGLVTQHGRQFGSVLSTQLTELLQKIGKGVDDIYVCCSDQGANMLKATDLIIEAQQQIDIYSTFADLNNEMENIQDILGDQDETIETEEEDESYNFDDIISIENGIGSLCSKGICGAHVCQLGAKEVTKCYEPILQKIRSFVKEAKKVVYLDIFRELKKPCSDIEPRWDSTYLMIQDFEENKLQYQQIRSEKLKLSRDIWIFIGEYYEAFKPVHLAMKDFQRADYTSSDFFLRWLRMEMQLEKIGEGKHKLASQVLKAMKDRSKKFLSSDAFAASLVLDPRFHWNGNSSIFDEDLRNKGIANILKVYQKLNANNVHDDTSVSIDELQTEIDEEELHFNQYIGGGNRVSYHHNAKDVKHQIMKFILNEPRVRATENFNVLSYWHNKRDDPSWRDLYKISQIVFGAAFSQVKVERDFSGFGLIYNHLRTRLSDETLNSIFVVKNNLDLIGNVKFF